jgi:hypothetical protein
MTPVIVAIFLAMLGLGADAAMHTPQVALAMHQVSNGPTGTGVCPQ